MLATNQPRDVQVLLVDARLMRALSSLLTILSLLTIEMQRRQLLTSLRRLVPAASPDQASPPLPV
jgi:hypothetical protein